MSTDVALVAERPTSLAAWAEGARSVHQLAEHVANSALVPQAYRGKPIDVLACWLTGQELGIQPMASLRAIDVIQGQPSLRAHAMRALVLSHGHELVLGENDDTVCHMLGRRKGSEKWQTVTWDIERAKRLGLTGKDQWIKQPRTMLIARATGEICRLIAADVLYAVPYTTEEVRDSDFDGDRPVRAEARVTGRDLLADAEPISQPATSSAQPGSNPEPWAPSGEPDPVDIGDAPEAMSAAQSRNLYRLLRATQREAKDDALRYLTLLFDREVTSTKELSKVEARIAIDDLEAQLAIAAEVDGEGGEQETLL